MSTKQAVLEMIRQMPEDVTVPDIMAELFVREKIDKGLQELERGEGIDNQEAKKRLARWLK